MFSDHYDILKYANEIIKKQKVIVTLRSRLNTLLKNKINCTSFVLSKRCKKIIKILDFFVILICVPVYIVSK